MKTNFTVYMHTNKINNKKYIGITSVEPKTRWKNGRAYTKNKYFTNSINKYGWNNFEHEILFINLTQEQAEILETELIKYYNTTNYINGYNCTNGGESTGKHTEETKQKLRDINLGKKASKETRLKMSKSRTGMFVGEKGSMWGKFGKENPFYGKKHTEETKNKMRCKRPSISSDKHPKARTIICIDTGIIYKTITEASRELNIHYNCIKDCCVGRQKTAGGYRWRYVDK